MFDTFEIVEPSRKRRRLHCNECGRRSIHTVETMLRANWDAPYIPMSGGTEYSLCRCGGCDTVIFVTDSWNSEEYNHGPDGELEAFITTVRYPGVEESIVASDTSDCPGKISEIIREATSSLANNNLLAATILARMTIEEICRESKAAGRNLEKKLDSLGLSLALEKDQLDLLHEIRKRGNKGAHEATGMSIEEIKAGFEIIDLIIDKKFVAPARAARAVKKAKDKLGPKKPKF